MDAFFSGKNKYNNKNNNNNKSTTIAIITLIKIELIITII